MYTLCEDLEGTACCSVFTLCPARAEKAGQGSVLPLFPYIHSGHRGFETISPLTSGLWSCSPSTGVLGLQLSSSHVEPCVPCMCVTHGCHTGPGAFVESVVRQGTSVRLPAFSFIFTSYCGRSRKGGLPSLSLLLSHAAREGLLAAVELTTLSFLLPVKASTYWVLVDTPQHWWRPNGVRCC